MHLNLFRAIGRFTYDELKRKRQESIYLNYILIKVKMSKLDLTQYGIADTIEIVHNPSYEELFKEETLPSLEGYEKGTVTELDAVNVI